jgi:tetratricopeptide (TPR) repeat protein
MTPQANNHGIGWSGPLSLSPVPELLAHAYNRGFSGCIVFRTPTGRRAMVACERGCVTRAALPDADQGLQQQALAPFLPGDLRRFAGQHAAQRDLSLLHAVSQLNLVSGGSLERAHDAVVHAQLRAIAQLPAQTLSEFYLDMNCFNTRPPVQRAVEPLGLILSCILAEPGVERCQQALDPARDMGLLLAPEMQSALGDLTGPLRVVVARLQRAPDSLEQLRQRLPIPADQLYAAVYTLRLTRRVTLKPTGSGAARGSERVRVPAVSSASSIPPAVSERRPTRVARQHSLAPTSGAGAATVSFPPTGPAASDPLPSTHPPKTGRAVDSSAPAATASTGTGNSGTYARHGTRPFTEPTAETKCVEVWLKASDDPRHLDRASAIVERCLQLYPNNARIRFCRGALLAQLGKTEQAVGHLQRAVELDPSDGQARAELRRQTAVLQGGQRKSLFSRFGGR